MADYNTGATYSYNNPAVTYTTTQTTTVPRRKLNMPIILLGILGIFLLLILLFLLFGSSGDNNNNDNTIDPNRKAVLQWWGVFLDKDVVQPLIDEYQADHPNITIEYANRWPGGQYEVAEKSYRSELNRLLTENDPVSIPDIFMVKNTWVGDYEQYTKPSSLHTIDTFKSSFYPAVVTDFANGNVIHGIPLWIDTLQVLFNRDLLENKSLAKPPLTWPEFKNAAKNLTVVDGGSIQTGGFSAGTGNNVSFGPEMLYILLVQNGVTISDSENQLAISTDSDSVGALSFYKDFETQKIWSTEQKNDSAEFLEGDLAMMFAPSWRYRDLLKLNDDHNLNLDIGVSEIPQLASQEKPNINWVDYWGNMVALNRPNSDISWDFLNWMTQPEQLKKLSENVKNQYGYFGILYPRIDMSTELQNDEYLKLYNSSLPNAESWYQVKGIEVKEIINELLSKPSSQSGVAKAENDIQLLIDAKGEL